MYIEWQNKTHIDAYCGTKFVNRTHKAVFGNVTLFTTLSKDDSYVSLIHIYIASRKIYISFC